MAKSGLKRIRQRAKHMVNPKNYSTRQKTLIFVVAFALIGITTVLLTHAATFVTSVQPEQGTVNSPAVAVTGDNTASGGGFVQFKAATAGGSCPVYPAMPNTSCTGYVHTNVMLTPYTGPCNITADNTVIDSKNITCGLTIQANNVTITRSLINYNPTGTSCTDWGINQLSGNNGLTVTDVEITAAVKPLDCKDSGIIGGGSGQNLTRVLIHNVGQGYYIGSNSTITDSFIGNLQNPCINPVTDSNGNVTCTGGGNTDHTSAIFRFGGGQNITIRHNYISCQGSWCSSAASFYPQSDQGGPNNGLDFENNEFNTDGSYCVYLGYTPTRQSPTYPGEGPNVNIKMLNNIFGTDVHSTCGQFGPVSYSHYDNTLYFQAFDAAGFQAAVNRINNNQDANYTGGWGSSWSGNTWNNGQVLSPGG